MDIRNIAIIAHVDHGKTTLVDALLKQSHTKLNKETPSELIMDSNELEKERGITIYSKTASVIWKDTKINIIDTPGHADFGGEVERVLSMADGCLLLVDAKEGPMPQTRFVLKKALKQGLKIIVVINKIDKSGARPEEIQAKTFDLFVELGADEETAFFPTIYASGRDGLAGELPDLTTMTDISPIFESVVKLVPPPKADPTKPLQMLVTTLGKDNFKGKIALGKIQSGEITNYQDVAKIDRTGATKTYKLTSLSTFVGLIPQETQKAQAGDIVALTGISDVTIGDTIADPLNPVALPLIAIEEPTVKMKFLINTSPFAGREGEFKTSRQIRERLYKETETDVALKVEDNLDGSWTVSGRGELHLAILIERMRREGYEFQVARPEVIIKEVDGRKMEPYEWASIEVPDTYAGTIIQKMNMRTAALQNMDSREGITYMEYLVATRELIGFRSEFITDTKGLGIFNSAFSEYKPLEESRRSREHGSLVAFETGITRMYGLTGVQERGSLFVGANVEVYKGQVVGQNSRADDIEVNVCKEKKLSNMRSKGDGGMDHFNAPKQMSLEEAIEYIDGTEYVEITPKNIRIRKIILDPVEARRQKKLQS